MRSAIRQLSAVWLVVMMMGSAPLPAWRPCDPSVDGLRGEFDQAAELSLPLSLSSEQAREVEAEGVRYLLCQNEAGRAWRHDRE